MNLELVGKQKIAYDLMKSGKNVFITGPGGSGKSFLISKFMKDNLFKKIGITSTTGTSAILIGGSTIHSFAGIGLGTKSVVALVTGIRRRPFVLKRWKELDTLIIDEVSMLTPELFDKLNEIAKITRRCDEPFGGLQLILTGDFLQLPCVNSDDFCFNSQAWKECVDNEVYLDKIIRQTDPLFQKCLCNIRLGIVTDEDKKLLNSRVGATIENTDIKPTQFYSTNAQVNRVNNMELDILAEEGVEFLSYQMKTEVMNVRTPQFVIDKCIKNCIAEPNLDLCVGAQVMLNFNVNTAEKLVNGSRGVIIRFEDDMPVVKFMDGREICISYNVWDIEEGGNFIMNIKQIPLRVAYAITIHKSQGMSVDCMKLDLSNIFENGQAYVALSRVRNIEGLVIDKIAYNKIKAHPRALEYYKNLL